MIDEIKFKILSKVEYPSDLKNLSIAELNTLCSEIRQYMVDTISQIGGHFGVGIGSV